MLKRSFFFLSLFVLLLAQPTMAQLGPKDGANLPPTDLQRIKVGEPAPDFDFSPLATGAVVTDIVYVPLITPILRQAREQGFATVDGLGMLLHQAAPGFEKWFGLRPTVDAELRRRVLADMEAH